MSSKPGTNACTRLAAGRSDTVFEEPNGGLCRGDVGRAEHRDLLAARRRSPTLRTPQEQWVECQGCQQKDNTLFAFRNDYSGFGGGIMLKGNQ